MHSIVDFNKTTNPTWEQYGLVWWSTLEVNIGVTVTCLPSLRLILLRIWPTTFGGGGSADVTNQDNSIPGQMPTIGSGGSSTRRGSEAPGPQHQAYRDANHPNSSVVSLYKKDSENAPSIEGATGNESCSRTSASGDDQDSSTEGKLDLKQVICIELGERRESGGK